MSDNRGNVSFIPGDTPGTDQLAVRTRQADGTLAWVALVQGATIPDPAPTPPAPPAPTPGATLPGQVLDLTNWKITLPTTSTPGARTGGKVEAAEVLQPALAKYTDNHFLVNTAGTGVTFKAPCGAPTTSGSNYPRSELREMIGAAEATWSCGTGRHHMQVLESVDVLPPHKSEVVCAQIHNAHEDVIEVMADGTGRPPGLAALVVRFRGKSQPTKLDPNYTLGTPFTLDITAQDGTITIAYNGTTILKLAAKDSGCYFKAGCYTQSNVAHGDSADAYGQTTIYKLPTPDHSGAASKLDGDDTDEDGDRPPRHGKEWKLKLFGWKQA